VLGGLGWGGRERERERERERDSERERQRDRETERQRERDREADAANLKAAGFTLEPWILRFAYDISGQCAGACSGWPGWLAVHSVLQ